MDEDSGIEVIVLDKGSDRYVFMFTDDKLLEVVHTFYRFAFNPELSLTMDDVAELCARIGC